MFFERGGSVDARGDGHPVAAGDLLVIAPGDVLTVDDPAALAGAEGWCVYFLPEALDAAVPGALLSWRAHPLLSTFTRNAGSALLRLSVPDADRARWAGFIQALETELSERRDGYREAALAQLVLLLVGVARLAGNAGGDLRRGDEPLLAEVFALIEHRYREPLSLRDVARAVNLSPGHLTTTVRHRTGRTVGDWILERRMVQARRFARQFRRVHGLSPRAWRRGEWDARGDHLSSAPNLIGRASARGR